VFPARVGNPELQTVLRRCFCRRRRVRQPGFCCRRERAVARGGRGTDQRYLRGLSLAPRRLPSFGSGGTSPGFEGARELGALYARQRDAAAATRVANSGRRSKVADAGRQSRTADSTLSNPELQTGTSGVLCGAPREVRGVFGGWLRVQPPLPPLQKEEVRYRAHQLRLARA